MTLELPDLAATRILVAGDVMLDRYWTGDTARISPEAPVPIVRIEDEEQRPGGAGNVALNVTALGAAATLLGVIGHDRAGEGLRGLLDRRERLTAELLEDPEAATVTKLRVLSRHQQLIRLDFERPAPGLDGSGVTQALERHLDEVDVVVLSDYAKGTLSDSREIVRRARAAGCAVLVDPKGRDFARYVGATLVTPNRGEFEAIAGPCKDDVQLVERARAIIENYGFEALLITRGEQGMTLVPAAGGAVHVPAHAREVYDVTGAGDTVIATLAVGVAAGLDFPDAARLANLAAGVVVGKLGAASVTPAELRQAIVGERDGARGIMDESVLGARLDAARERGERIVMTNGCFDLLHAGHVRYLEDARALGDRLVVAVNDDESVHRLKGEGRPVSSLDQRMAVLAGLSAVDWVVPFSEDTPARLICAVRPDVLVKGGDYKAEEVAGRECAGEVQILEYYDGPSTSNLIDAIRRNFAGES